MKHPMCYDPIEIDLFADVASVLNGNLEPELPTVGALLAGRCLLYAGRINEIHGEPSVGKTNVALAVARPLLQAGRTVAFIDPEDTAASAVRRLLAFGCTREQIIAGLKYTGCPASAETWRILHLWARRDRPDLVIIDGVAEILASLLVEENDPAAFLAFCRTYLKPFTDLGLAVLLSDHVTKNSETRSLWSRGTGAKLGKYDGVSYSVELGKGYSPRQAGYVKLRVAKDRQGGVGAKGEIIAEIHFTPGEANATLVEFREAAPSDRPSALSIVMDKICRKLQEEPDASLRTLRKCGSAQSVNAALAALEAQGLLEISPGGPGRPTRYVLTQPDDEDEDTYRDQLLF